MPTQTICEILETARLGEAAYKLVLNAGRIAQDALPGQFLHIACGSERLLRRPISICDAEGDNLTIVVEARGKGSKWLTERQVGDRLDVLGPLGHGFDVTGARILLVGGGLGIPPLLLAARRAAGEVYAALGFRSAARAALVEEFRAISADVTLASDDGSLGLRGTAADLMRDEFAKGNRFTHVLACGARPMLRAVAQIAAEYGVSCQVSMEERMACGVGACLVCACKNTSGGYLHVCKNGPVFDAAEVDWDE